VWHFPLLTPTTLCKITVVAIVRIANETDLRPIPIARAFHRGDFDLMRQIMLSGLAALLLITGWSELAQAQQQQACFIGNDHTGGPARLLLVAERYGDYFELFGRLSSSAVGTMQLKADGWSGAGRMFRGHEYESGALYIQISDYTGSSFILSVDGYGRFQFRQTRC
jgi:hypothetical protein